MSRSLLVVLCLSLLGCPAQAPPPPPGFVVGPNGVQMPGINVTPNGVQMPGINVTPNGVQMPGINVTPNGVQMPGVSVGPGGIQAPGVSIAAPAPGAAPSVGIPECDQYVLRACSCSNQMARGPACMAAQTAAGGWATAIAAGGPRDAIAQSCAAATVSLASTCP